jgi:cysteine-rich repeat protein
MRTPLVLLFGSLLVGCTVGDPGTGGDDDGNGGGGAVCGDGVKEGSEACDDGNAAGGDGCSASCQDEAQPRLTVTVDKPTFNTQLLTTNMVTVTLQAAGGFSGQVTLAPSVVDAAGNPIAAWTATLDKTTVDVPADGSATVVATLKIPSENLAPMGTLRIEATSSLGSSRAESAATVLNQLSFPVTLNANNCVYPAFAVGTVKVRRGTKLRFENRDATQTMIFHISVGVAGLAHQPDSGTLPNTVYEQTVGAAATGTTDWYCHNRNNPNNMRIEVAL